MPNSPPRERLFRISLRELLVLVALVALAIPSLKYASDVWLALVAAVAMIALFVALIVAVVDRGPRQAVAIGFALVMGSYGLMILNGRESGAGGRTRNVELSTSGGSLPTTRLLRHGYTAVSDFRWIDQAGKEVVDFEPPAAELERLARAPIKIDLDPTTLRDRLRSGRSLPGVSIQGVSLRKVPVEAAFMRIGHWWWALLLGYAGGHFARFIYWRRIREQQPLAGESS